MAALTDQQIKDYALQLEQKGAPAQEIEAFVSAAVSERGKAPEPAKAEAPASYGMTGAYGVTVNGRPQAAGPAPAGIKDFLAGAALEGGGATAGQAIGAMTGVAAPVAVPVLGAIGGAGGYALNQRRMGQPITAGGMASAAIGGAVPGGSLAGASGRKVATEAGKYAAQNLAAVSAESLIEEGKMPEFTKGLVVGGVGAIAAPVAKKLDTGTNAVATAERQLASQQGTRRETLRLGRELGYVVPPSVVRPSAGNNFINSVGGKAATAQEVVQRNQPITNAAVREELGLPKDTALSPKALEVAKLKPSKTYADMAALSPQASVALEEFKKAQSEAQAQFFIWRNQVKKDSSLLESARQKRSDAEAMLTELKNEATKAGKPELFDEFNEARVKLAQIGIVERAMNKGTGDVDARILGDAYDAGEKLTGKLEAIGRFQQAFAQSVKDAATSPPSGVSQLLPYVASAAGGAGVMSQGAMGAAYAAPFLLAPSAARTMALSPIYQNQFVKYSAGTTRQDVPAMAGRFMTQDAGRMMVRPLPPPAAPEPEPEPTPEPTPEPPPEPPKKTVFKEGKVYRDPETGERKRYKNGEFVPV